MASRGTVEVWIWDLNPGVISFRLSFNHLAHKPLQWVWEWLALALPAKSLQSCLTLWDPLDCSLQGSSVHGILQTRILEWVVMPSYRRSSQPRAQTHISFLSCTGRAVFTTNSTSLAQMCVWQKMKSEETHLLRTQMSKRKVGCSFLPLDRKDLTIHIRTKESTKHWPEYHVLLLWGVWRSEWLPLSLSQVERIKGKTFPVSWASQSSLDSQDNFLQPLWASVSFPCNRGRILISVTEIPAARIQVSSVQSFSHVQRFATPWTTAHQASLSITISRNLLKLKSIASVMPVYLMKCTIL